MKKKRLFDVDMLWDLAAKPCPDYLEAYVDSEIKRNLREFASEVWGNSRYHASDETKTAIENALKKRGTEI